MVIYHHMIVLVDMIVYIYIELQPYLDSVFGPRLHVPGKIITTSLRPHWNDGS
jgi:hypothetical protein